MKTASFKEKLMSSGFLGFIGLGNLKKSTPKGSYTFKPYNTSMNFNGKVILEKVE